MIDTISGEILDGNLNLTRSPLLQYTLELG